MTRLTKSESNTYLMVEEALRCLSGEKAVEAVLQAFQSHPRLSVEDLENLGNRLGRVAHEKARYK